MLFSILRRRNIAVNLDSVKPDEPRTVNSTVELINNQYVICHSKF